MDIVGRFDHVLDKSIMMIYIQMAMDSESIMVGYSSFRDAHLKFDGISRLVSTSSDK